jgi:hypothetical protein
LRCQLLIALKRLSLISVLVLVILSGCEMMASETEVSYPGSDCILALRSADGSTSPPAGDGQKIPKPVDPHIPSGSKCRGACGSDCPSTCKSKPDIKICVEDQWGKFHEYWKYAGVIECGSAEACRVHDQCYDDCAGDPTPATCRLVCDKNNYDKYGVKELTSWMSGNGPFDRYILYSDKPVSDGGFMAGPCPSCCPDISGPWKGYLTVISVAGDSPIISGTSRPVQGDKFVVDQTGCDIKLKFDNNEISGKMEAGAATLQDSPNGTVAKAMLKLESGKLIVLLDQITFKGATITSQGTLSK